MNPVELAKLVAASLATVAPEGYFVVPDGPYVSCGPDPESGGYIDGPGFGSETLDISAEKIMLVAEGAMENLQEIVVEGTGAIWPAVPQPHCHVEIQGTQLLLWWGDRRADHLECPPIEIG